MSLTKIKYFMKNNIKNINIKNNNKYILLKVKNPDHSNRNCLYRIKAIKSFNDVKVGDLGGYISGEHNLSQTGECWVYDDSMILDNAFVEENALVFRNSIVNGEARISSNVLIIESKIEENAYILGDSRIFDSNIKNNSSITGSAIIINSIIKDNVEVKNNATVVDAKLNDFIKIYDNGFVYRSSLNGSGIIKNNAIIRKSVLDTNDEYKDDIFINKNNISSPLSEAKILKEKSIENNYNPQNKFKSKDNLLIKDIGNLISKIEKNKNNIYNTKNNIYNTNKYIYAKSKPKIIDEYIKDETSLNQNLKNLILNIFIYGIILGLFINIVSMIIRLQV